ncbi:MAG: RluA family pseudouridine synthase [Verrucomicrobiales bacterium]
MEFRITEAENAGERLDRFLARQLPECSRSRLQALVREGHILVDGNRVKPKHPLAHGEHISVEFPEPEPSSVEPEEIAIDILHQDEDLLVLFKPPGLVVHPGAGNPSGTLVNALLFHCGESLSGIGGVLRPGIVHRLDKDTSGCMVVAKNDLAHNRLARQFSERTISKEYLAVVERRPLVPGGRIENRIGRHPVNRLKMAVLEPPGGKLAITEYRAAPPLDDGTALVHCRLHTGRTHQIRVHMLGLRSPILGDKIYATPKRQPRHPGRLMLHAWKLGFNHPASGQALRFEAKIPAEFADYLENLPGLLDSPS